MTVTASPIRLGLLILVLATTAAAVQRVIVLRLDARPSGAIGPFLQRATLEAITVRWRTERPESSQVAFRALDTEEWSLASPSLVSQDHTVRLAGLNADTRYEYRPGGAERSDRHAVFKTPPVSGDAGPHRIWLLGDPGVNNRASHAVRDSALSWMTANPHRDADPPWPDFILTSGDNAYPSGRDRDFRDGIFMTYADVLPFIPLWPVHGNHDARRDAYRRIFDLPMRGESGGLASGTERYWSFHHGNVHIVALDSEQADLSTRSAMGEWLQQSLTASDADWVIVVVHRAPHSRGSNDTDRPRGSDWRQLAIREDWMPIVEAHGVDLIISGHSHVYERSHLVGGFFGRSDTFNDSHLMSHAKGTLDDPYRRPRDCDHACGSIYLVAGMSALPQEGPLDHPMMVHSESTSGAVILDIQGLELTGYFLRVDGTIGDRFRIVKDEA